MTSEEFTAWQAYDSVEGIPWPWLQSGVITANTVNLWSRRATSPRDFMPVTPRAPAWQSADVIQRNWDRFVAANNARYHHPDADTS